MLIPYDNKLGVHQQAEGSPSTSRGISQRRAGSVSAAAPLSLLRSVSEAGGQAARPGAGDAALPATLSRSKQKARNFDYYERITVRDSSLSACTQAVIAAEIGHLRLALDYVAESALMDLHDFEHNTRDGLHMAALGRNLDRARRRLRRATRSFGHARVQPPSTRWSDANFVFHPPPRRLSAGEHDGAGGDLRPVVRAADLADRTSWRDAEAEGHADGDEAHPANY